MALPACFRLADETFPKVRHLASHALRGHGWSQPRIAEALGISQPMVSKYLARNGPDDVLAARLSADLVQSLTTDAKTASWCRLLEPQDAALDDLLAAEAWLLRENPVQAAPQIGMNLAAGTRRIYSYPARIVAAGDRLVAPAPPSMEEGHLARCLRTLQDRFEVGALLSCKGGTAMEKATQAAGLRVVRLPDGDRDPETRFRDAVHACQELPDAFHDPGAHGIEPCLYLPAPTAQQAVHNLLKVTP